MVLRDSGALYGGGLFFTGNFIGETFDSVGALTTVALLRSFARRPRATTVGAAGLETLTTFRYPSPEST